MGVHPLRPHAADLARSVDVAARSRPRDTLNGLRRRLRARVRKGLELAPSWNRAGVLVPLVPREEHFDLLLTRRTETVLAHKGQISFPGGQQESGDETLLDTALRETSEEIGLEPHRVTMLGELDDVLTAVSGFVITPYVGVVSGGVGDLRPAPQEVKDVLLVPVDRLREPGAHQSDTRIVDGKPVEMHSYTVGEDVIWGATGRILHQLLALWP